MIPNLYIYADKERGLGHTMRCRGVEEEWKRRKGKVYWGRDSKDIAGLSVVIFDGYDYPNSARRGLRYDSLVVSFSDYAEELDTDVLVNYNLGASKLNYTGDIGLKLFEPLYFPMLADVKRAKINTNGGKFDTVNDNDRSLTHEEFVKKMASAAVVVCAASVRAYEALYLNKEIWLTVTAENQQNAYDELSYNQWVFTGYGMEIKKGRKLVDGNGAKRLVDAILWAYGVKYPNG